MNTIITAKNLALVSNIVSNICAQESYIAADLEAQITDKLMELDAAQHEIRNIRGYVARLARNLRINRLRDDQNKRSIAKRLAKLEETHYPCDDDFDQVIEETIKKYANDSLEKAIVTGSCEGMTEQEIADLYDLSKGQIAGKARRMKLRLRDEAEIKALYSEWQQRLALERQAVPTPRYHNELS